MDNKGIQNIKKMYDKLNYFDQYGASVLLFIVISIILFIAISYCFAKINAQPIIDDWPAQRCKPNIIPFAGFITHPDGISASDYTAQNFTYCTQNILSNITGMAVEPITFIVNMFKNIVEEIKNEIQSIRAMFDKVRNMFQEVSEEIMGRIMNFSIPLQQIIISFKDLVAKIQGTMTAGLFTLLGSYYTLKSLMGAIAEFIIIILIALAAMIAVFWIFPFTWGAAIANTAIFIAIAIPMIIILAFMIDVLHVQTDLSIPSVKCFDENTIITMNDGTKKKISEIQLGDILFDNNEVTACIKVETKGSTMYTLDNIIVSDSHIVFYNEKWIPVRQHPRATKYMFYDKPYLFCLNTTNKILKINSTIFTDWDELYSVDILEITYNKLRLINNVCEIHSFLDGGFEEKTKIKLQNGSYKCIKEIQIGDILEKGEKVYGVVKINGNNLNEQCKYNLGNNEMGCNLIVEGGPNLAICDKKINFLTTLSLDSNNKEILISKHKVLYHLLTDKKTFHIENIRFCDYNAAIDLFLEKNKGKLLSMKYV
jgi:hypothetical protein